MMKRTIFALMAAALFAASASAITNGVPDGNAHPFVGVASSGDWFCSGTLLSPTVFLTAGHCTDAFASTGEPTYVTVDPNAGPSSAYVTGTPDTEPGFFNIPPLGVGVPASVGNDLGVIVLDRPILLSSYGQLPRAGSLTGPGVALTAVGYGAQGSVPAPHGHVPLFTFVRTRADVSSINDTNAIGDEFARLSTNPGDGKGGIGIGDSGAPAFFAGTSTIAAIGSHVTNPNGAGTAYFSRLDTAAALAYVTPFLR
jgi:Trypsin